MKTVLEYVGIEVDASILNEVFAKMLEKKVLDGWVIPQKIRNTVMYTLVTDVKQLKNAVPFAPVFNVNVAAVLRKWLVENRKLGLIAKPCEIRAAIELTKLNQISKGSILFFCTDCLGTYKNKDYIEHVAETKEKLDIEKKEELSERNIKIREACEICKMGLTEIGDFAIKHVGLDKIFIQGLTDFAKETILSIGEAKKMDESQLEKREETRKDTLKEANLRRAKLSEQLSELKDIHKLVDLFDKCTLCKNCRDACPVCYCEKCIFDQSVGKPVGKDLLDLAEMSGVVRVPANVLHYHLTRLYHVSTSCVGCGACQDACPQDIPLTRIFPLVPESVQQTFGYEAGMNIEEPQPLRTFNEKEFEPE